MLDVCALLLQELPVSEGSGKSSIVSVRACGSTWQCLPSKHGVKPVFFADCLTSLEQVETCQPARSRRSEALRLCHRDVSEHVGHLLSSSRLGTRRGKEVGIWAGYSGVSSRYKFKMTKILSLGLWKQKKSIGIETCSPGGWISKVIVHWEEDAELFYFDCRNIAVSYAQAFVSVSSTEKVQIKEECQGRCSTEVYQDWKLWFLFLFVFLIPILMKQNKNDTVLQTSA